MDDFKDVKTLAREYLQIAEMDAALNPPVGDAVQVLFLPVGGPPEIRLIQNDWKAWRDIVGGPIETDMIGYTPTGGRLAIVCHADGKVLPEPLPLNRILKTREGRIVEEYVGDIFITACNMRGEEIHLDDDYAKHLAKQFAGNEVIID